MGKFVAKCSKTECYYIYVFQQCEIRESITSGELSYSETIQRSGFLCNFFGVSEGLPYLLIYYFPSLLVHVTFPRVLSPFNTWIHKLSGLSLMVPDVALEVQLCLEMSGSFKKYLSCPCVPGTEVDSMGRERYHLN